MKYAKIFVLHFENLLEHRSTSFVWFLISIINPLILIIFWNASLSSGQQSISGWNLSALTSYYILLVIANVTLMSHVERMISERDIKRGEMVAYLMKPLSYTWFKFFEETPSRILQGSFGMIVFFVVLFLYSNFVDLDISSNTLLSSSIIIILAYSISFFFKMIVGIIAFWITDIVGLNQLIDVVIIIFAGSIVPLPLLPSPLNLVANILPFSYMIYYPVASFQGRLSFGETFQTILIQLLWLFALIVIFKFLWKSGINKFSGVGQ